MADTALISLTADIVSAHVSNNHVATSDVPTLIRSVYDAMEQAARPAEPEPPRPEPAVPIRSSVKHDHIVCLEDGAKLKMLKRYLRRRYGLSPEEYRAKWGLPGNYPMVAPAYAEQRTVLAKKIGLGRRRDQPATMSEASVAAEEVQKSADHAGGDGVSSEIVRD